MKPTPKKVIRTLYCTKDEKWYAFATKKDAIKSLKDDQYDGGLIGEICEKWDERVGLDKMPDNNTVVVVKLEMTAIKMKDCPKCHIGFVDAN